GGTCVNTGCTPTKTLIASAYVAHVARRAADYGVDIGGTIAFDLKKAKARADAVVMDSRTKVEAWLCDAPGVTVLHGHAAFEGPHSVRVGDDVLTASQIFINVGGRALVPDFPGVGDVSYLTNTSILALDTFPRHLIVVGGSYIGLEFAQMYRRFGAEVTIIEKALRLITREDEDVSDAVRKILEDEGISVRTQAECIAFKSHPDGISARVDCTGGEPDVIGSHLLLAVGRVPNTDDLGLERAGIATDAKGYITVDDELRTSVAGIWALGDCNGRGAFTHTSYNDYEIVAANLLDGEHRRVSERIAAYALYIDPPLGRVGMTEAQARASGRPLLVNQRPMTRVSRAIEKGETKGFMKVVADRETKRILGAAILGTSGDEAIHGFIDMMSADQPYTAFQRAVPIHPNVSELIPTLVSEMHEPK
ncbi:MAG: FAD-containing oxidoreductase, partial [Burkholderiaceae bacterium]